MATFAPAGAAAASARGRCVGGGADGVTNRARRRAPTALPLLAAVGVAAAAALAASAAAVAWLQASPVASGVLAVASRRGRHLRLRQSTVAAGQTFGAAAGVVDELEALAQSPAGEDKDAMMKAVDEAFPRIMPQDLAELQARMTAAMGEGGNSEAQAALMLLSQCVQACMESRMGKAKDDIEELLMSSGNIDDNIRACLAKQESPVPIMTLLQMNMAQAQRNGDEKQQRALGYVAAVMSGELEKKEPLAKRVVSRLLSSTDVAARRKLLHGVLNPKETDRVESEDIADMLCQLVADTERQAKAAQSSGTPEEEWQKMRTGTLDLIRTVAVDAGVVIGEVCGTDAQEEFTIKLTPLFEALSNQ